jgi:hypothetical protein
VSVASDCDACTITTIILGEHPVDP